MQKKVAMIALSLILGLTLLATGCSNPLTGGKGEIEAGYYKNIIMQPNGEFIVSGRIDEKKAAGSGLVYKVEMNNQKKLSRILAVYNEKPMNQTWFDSTYACFTKFAAITVEYQDGYVKYNFLDEHMQPTRGFYRAHSIRYKMGEKSPKPVMGYLYDEDGNQIASTGKNTYAQMLFTYDKEQVLTKIGYANANGERVTRSDKIYEIGLKYDKKYLLPIELTIYGQDGNLVLGEQGYAKEVFKYDEKGRLAEIRYLGTDEALRMRLTNYAYPVAWRIRGIGAGAVTKYIYTGEQQQPNMVTFYGTDEQPVGLKPMGYEKQKQVAGYASIKLQYDEKGNIVRYSLWGTDGLPKAIDSVKLGDAVVERRFGYDDYGNESEIANYNKDGTLAAVKEGWAICREKYNDQRDITERAYFGTNDEPINVTRTMASGSKKTYHRTVFEYDDNGKFKDAHYYDKDGNDTDKKPVNKQAGLEKFFGRWYMEGPTTAASAQILFTEDAIIFVPLHDVNQIPRSSWKKMHYTVNSVNVNPTTNEGFAFLKFDNGTLNRFDLHGASRMTWDKYKYTWTRRSTSTNYDPAHNIQ